MYIASPIVSSTSPATSTCRTGRRPSRTSSVTVSPGVTPRTSARILREDHAGCRHLHPAPVAVDDPFEARVRRHTGERQISLAVARPDAHGDRTLRLDGDDARQACERMAGLVGARFDERDRDVLPLAPARTASRSVVRSHREHEADHEDGDGESDADDRRRGAQRVARDVAQHHASGGAEVTGDPRRFEHRPPIPCWRLRPHRLGRRHRTARRTAEKAPAPAATKVIAIAPNTTDSGTLKRSSGKRKNWL